MLAAGTLALVASARLALAQPGGAVRVIELFTSQGCPKCPAADRLIAELARAPDTIALSFPVSYWDYGGWKDTLAQPASTRRQRAYAQARGDGLIYTPQVIVDGLGVRPGANRAAILDDTHRLKGERGAMTVPIKVSETDGRLAIDVGAGEAGAPPAGIYVARVARVKTVAVASGGNSGRSLTYTNVVRAMTRVGDWTGHSRRFDVLDLKGDDEGYVVLLQAGTTDRPGAILAAAKTPDL